MCIRDRSNIDYRPEIHSQRVQNAKEYQKRQYQKYQNPVFGMKFQISDVECSVKIIGKVSAHAKTGPIGQNILQFHRHAQVFIRKEPTCEIVDDQEEKQDKVILPFFLIGFLEIKNQLVGKHKYFQDHKYK